LDGVNKKSGDHFFNGRALKTSALGMLRGGLLGGALGYGADRLGNYLAKKQDQKHMTPQQLRQQKRQELKDQREQLKIR